MMEVEFQHVEKTQRKIDPLIRFTLQRNYKC